VRPPDVVVATSRSPEGQPVPIAMVQHGMDLVHRHGAVTIDVDTLGHRSSFVGAVLATLPGATLSGSPPVVSLLGESGDVLVDDVVFEGETSAHRTVETRKEQRSLRALLFGLDAVRRCALCGDQYPVAFLRAAHIKPRSKCTEDERKQLSRIAMSACVFGCDALFEAGFVSVDEHGQVVVSAEVNAHPALSRGAGPLAGRDCLAFGVHNAELFEWHRENVFRR
jgi:hypothetical protein